MEIGAGIALGSLCVSAGAVAITAIRAQKKENGSQEKTVFPCKEHSGVIMCLANIEKDMQRQEEWLQSIAKDLKSLLIKADLDNDGR